MPELPEVEAAGRRLAAWLTGQEVVATRASGSRLFPAGTAEVARRTVGHRCTGVHRRGKYLLVPFDGGGALLLHLGMSGRFERTPPGVPAPPRTHLSLELRDGSTVHALSTRLLGRIVAGAEADLRRSPPWAALGRDPLADGLTPEWLAQALAGTRAPVKAALMDQGRLAGVGNIQAAEALWRAGIHPGTRTDRLEADDWARLCRGLLGTLEDTLADLLAEDVRYVSEGGDNPFSVYGREGEPCPRCGAPILRSVQGGRSTFACPRCQAGP